MKSPNFSLCFSNIFLSDLWKRWHFSLAKCKAKKKYMCVYGHMSKKSRVGRSAFFFYKLLAKPEIVVPGSGIWFRYSIFEISGKPSFVLWRVTQFFYLLCSQFRQKTLLLIKQHKWLSEFSVKIDRVVSKN
jgi:D-alanyl-lipoteichoic acid acyltransferase DltB (MBOAT superfamily)